MPNDFDVLKNAKEILQTLTAGSTLSTSGSTPKNEPLKTNQNEDTKMKTGTKKVHKIAKGKAVEKLLDRLSSLHTFERLSVKLKRWQSNEENADSKAKLQEICDKLAQLDKDRTEVVQLASTLQANGYKPPKRQGVAGLKFDEGKHVWLKPKFAGPFTKVYGEEVLKDLYVDTMIGGRVFVSLGKPEEGMPTQKLALTKQLLQMSDPIAA